MPSCPSKLSGFQVRSPSEDVLLFSFFSFPFRIQEMMRVHRNGPWNFTIGSPNVIVRFLWVSMMLGSGFRVGSSDNCRMVVVRWWSTLALVSVGMDSWSWHRTLLFMLGSKY